MSRNRQRLEYVHVCRTIHTYIYMHNNYYTLYILYYATCTCTCDLGLIIISTIDMYRRIRNVRPWVMHLRNPPKKGMGL